MITTFRSGVHHTDGLLSAKYAAVHCQKVDGQQWRRIAHKKRMLDEQRIERWTSRMLSARSTPELHALNVLRCKLGALLVYKLLVGDGIGTPVRGSLSLAKHRAIDLPSFHADYMQRLGPAATTWLCPDRFQSSSPARHPTNLYRTPSLSPGIPSQSPRIPLSSSLTARVRLARPPSY